MEPYLEVGREIVRASDARFSKIGEGKERTTTIPAARGVRLMSGRGGDEAVQDALTDALEGSEPGTQASGQTEGQIENPHGSDNHTDSWSGTKEEDGSVTFNKEHT